MLGNFMYCNPTKLNFGEDPLSCLNEEIPKYGKNVQDEPGSGLGLYIVSYIMERMKGGLVLENHEDGLEAVLWLPVS